MELNILTLYPLWFLLLVFILGSCIYSFLNVVIYRVPLHINITIRRSRCIKCGHVLSLLEMVPVAGWFLLSGKCRHCRARISFRYPLVEVMGGVIALICIQKWGISWQAFINYLFIAVLTVAAFVDMDTMKIPNCLIIAIGIIGILAIPVFTEISIIERIIGFLGISTFLLVIAQIVPKGFGRGDIKFIAACGFFMGWKQNIAAFALAILIAGVFCILMLVIGKIKLRSRIAFGPFLCLGMAVVLFIY